MDHPSRAELAALCEGGLSPERERTVVRHLVFQRCPRCLAAAPPPLGVLLGLEPARPAEEEAYDAAIVRAGAKALDHERRLQEQRAQADVGLRTLEAGRGLPPDMEVLARVAALLARSWQLRHDNPREMVRLARSAARASLKLKPGVHGPLVFDYQAEAHAELGNAYRAANRPQDAEKALERARELFEQGTRHPHIEVRLLELEASLLADLGEFGAASHKLLKVLTFYTRHEDHHRAGRTLVLIGLYAGYAGHFDLGIRRLQQSLELIDGESDPALACAAAHNLILFLVDSDRIPEARKLRIRYSWHLARPGGRINQIKFRLLEGRIDAGLGHHARAETIYHEVIAGLDEAGLPILAGIERLHLAAVLLRQNKAREAAGVVLAAVEVFIANRIRREALQAIILLRDSFQMGTGTLEMILEVTAFLRRLEIDPTLRFEARAWDPPEE